MEKYRALNVALWAQDTENHTKKLLTRSRRFPAFPGRSESGICLAGEYDSIEHGG